MTEHRIVPTGLNLVCADVDATMAFYREAGVDLGGDDNVWRTATGAHHVNAPSWRAEVGLEFDSTALAEVYNAGYAAAPSPGGVLVGFRVPTREAVDEVHARLTAAGHASRQEPFDAFWGARFAVVADPDGRDVGFMSPADDPHRSAPPEL
jgi:catechol 2,3-dioxygenase-like lactoylglutathione lyase family enzyme